MPHTGKQSIVNHNPTKQQAKITLERLLPRLEGTFRNQIKDNQPSGKQFVRRLDLNFPTLFDLYYRLYSDQNDFYYHLEELIHTLARMWFARSDSLKGLDQDREANPLWFQSNKMLGGVCYVDLFAGNLDGIRAKIPYFKELGLTYLHLMPLFLAPEGENDGGYAISSYRKVNPKLGTIEELEYLSGELRNEGISLVLDLVFNHTSNESSWALQARGGNLEYQEYYRIFPDRSMPDAYEKHLREIFPDEHPGAFTLDKKLGEWVWTTFHTYQWDLNYANPVVFNRMVEEMLFLSNLGVEVLRLDAVAFIWKQLGTSCENLPEAHILIKAFNTASRIAAPALLFKSEAIVHPDEVNKYISPEECPLSYNPLLMALLWNSLATREVRLLKLALQERFEINSACAWVNYVRVHDDIGWTFSDEDAARLWINGYDHRQFLQAFYSGQFEGSFARGVLFQANPKTGDARISGTCASLAGLEKAINEETDIEIELAIRRIILLHGVILTIGGIPLIYLGDEVGTLNDYSYLDDPSKAHDSRWAHRPKTDWVEMEKRHQPDTIQGQIYQRLRGLIRMRKENNVFSGGKIDVLDQKNEHILCYTHTWQGQMVVVLANFTEQVQSVEITNQLGLDKNRTYLDIVSGKSVDPISFSLDPYQFTCIKLRK